MKKRISCKASLLLYLALSIVSMSAYGQYKMGSYSSSKNKFTVVESDSALTHQWYRPKSNKQIYYNGYSGEKNYLSRRDAIYVRAIEKGSWAGKTGKWAKFNDYDFVWFNDLENYNQEYIANIEHEKNMALWAMQERWDREFAEFLKIVAIGVAVIAITIILIVWLYRRRRRCPNCKAPSARVKLGDQFLGKKSHLTQMEEERYVSGRWNSYLGRNEGGYVKVPVLKKRTTRYYTRHYKCKYCKHTWTKDYTKVGYSDVGDIEIK